MSDDQRVRYLSEGDPDDLDADVLAALDDLSALLDDPSLWVEPPSGLVDDVVAAIAAELRLVAGDQGLAGAGLQGTGLNDEKAGATSSGHGRSTDGRPADNVVPIGSAGRHRTRWVQPFMAGVAVAAISAIGVLALVRGDSTPGDTVEIALAGTELAPVGVAGTAQVTATESGLRIELDATGLPRRDGRQFYQAWLKGESGLVPIGTFHTGDDVVLWAGVALVDFPTLTVTLEEVGDQESSGQRVLIGSVSGE